MALAAFHPLVQQWFRDTLGEPTAAQRRGWESIRAGCHTLIAAPTGSGKTLAAFLSALDDTVFFAGANAHPGPTIEMIGSQTASIAERIGKA